MFSNNWQKEPSICVPMRLDISGGLTDLRAFALGRTVTHISCSVNRFVTCRVTSCRKKIGYVENLVNNICDHLPIFLDRKSLPNFVFDTTGPHGAGLGSSSAATVALTLLIAQITEIRLDKLDVVNIAMKAERASGNLCGSQDHFAAVFRGFQSYRISEASDFISCKTYSLDFVDHLQSRVLCFRPAIINQDARPPLLNHLETQIIAGNIFVLKNLCKLEEIACNLLDSIRGDFHDFSYLIRKVGYLQNEIAPGIMPQSVFDFSYFLWNKYHAGVKAAGAGGPSGCFLAAFPEKYGNAIKIDLEKNGFEVLDLFSSSILSWRPFENLCGSAH